MQSKDVVLSAINHHETERIGVDLGGSVQSTIHIYAYAALKEALGITEGEASISDTFILSAKVEDSVRKALGIDTIPLYCPVDALGVRNDTIGKHWVMPSGLKVKISSDFNAVQQEDGSYLVTRKGFVFKLPTDGYYFDPIKYALEESDTKKDIEENFNFSSYNEQQVTFLRKQAEELANTDKAVIGDVFASFSAEDVFGYEKAYINLLAERELTLYFMDRLTDMFIRNFNKFYDAVGDVCDIMMIHKDMGNQNGPTISPQSAREVFMPCFRKFIDHVKSKSNYKIMMHNCGSIYAFIPDLIDVGVDILNPIQFTAKDMELKKLKREFGKNLCFWGGGVDTQHVLPYGSEEDVRRQVRENASILSRGGGWVFNPVHCIQAKVPAANIIAAFEEIKKYN